MVSKRFKHWVSVIDSRRCIECKEMHGKIYWIREKANEKDSSDDEELDEGTATGEEEEPYKEWEPDIGERPGEEKGSGGKPPLHKFCRCNIVKMTAIRAGLATDKRKEGADYWLKEYGELPDYYVTKKEADEAGWKSKKGNFHKLFPGKMLTRGVYNNVNGHLPRAPDRIWYEADINYDSGRRNKQRVLYSSDGLIFVTYDHYHTFSEIV